MMNRFSSSKASIQRSRTRFSVLLAIAAVHLALIEAFLTNHSPHKNTVEAYLEALRSNSSKEQEFYCLNTLLDPSSLENVQAWEFIDQSPRIQEHDPHFHAIDVVMQIKSTDEDNLPISQTWQFVVWNSNALSVYKTKLSERLNQPEAALSLPALEQIPEQTHCIIHLQPISALAS